MRGNFLTRIGMFLIRFLDRVVTSKVADDLINHYVAPYDSADQNWKDGNILSAWEGFITSWLVTFAYKKKIV